MSLSAFHINIPHLVSDEETSKLVKNQNKPLRKVGTQKQPTARFVNENTKAYVKWSFNTCGMRINGFSIVQNEWIGFPVRKIK